MATKVLYIVCFNGAVPFQARKYFSDYKPQIGNYASMGPCLFRHGNSVWYGGKIDGYTASMGPCLFRHGNKRMSKTCHGLIVCFNGAVPFQARKCITWTWNDVATGASMGPCLFRHGNHLPT